MFRTYIMMRYACNNWSGLVLDNELAAGVWGRCGCCELSASRGSFGPSQGGKGKVVVREGG